jgi:hypothetical protein
VAAVATALAKVGATLEAERPDSGPTVWRCVASTEAVAAGQLEGLPTPVGAGVQLAPAFSDRLAGGLPGLAAVARELPRMQAGGQGLERFDLTAAAWGPAELDSPGAYRFEHVGRTYAFVTPEDLAAQVARVGEPALVKHLAAQSAGVSLLAYDAARQALTAPLGAEPPQLLERVAVACSGTLPRLRADLGQLEYAFVPPRVAEALQRALHAA